MRVAVVGRTYLLHANQAKWRHLPQGVALTLITPAAVQHTLRTYSVEPSQRWPHQVLSGWMTDRQSGFHFSPLPLWQVLRRIRPHLVQIDEEPSSLGVLEVLLLKGILKYRVVFFTWENVVSRYPPPFGLVRRVNLRLADGAIAGNSQAVALLQRAGFRKPMAVIAQMGVDHEHFAPRRAAHLRSLLGLTTFTVGYVGRLVPEKGLLTLLEALTKLRVAWQWLIVGRGPLRPALEQQAQRLGMAERLRWVDTVPHHDVAHYLNAMDVLVLPSQSTSRWREQFGHVLIEAMACGVPVVGSDCGAIPEVIGDAGLIFPERQADVLAQHLEHLHQDASLREALGRNGRERVLAQFTDRRIAERTVAFWRKISPCE